MPSSLPTRRPVGRLTPLGGDIGEPGAVRGEASEEAVIDVATSELGARFHRLDFFTESGGEFGGCCGAGVHYASSHFSSCDVHSPRRDANNALCRECCGAFAQHGLFRRANGGDVRGGE